jgi:hypothetical protein
MYDDDGGAPFEKVADTKDGIACGREPHRDPTPKKSSPNASSKRPQSHPSGARCATSRGTKSSCRSSNDRSCARTREAPRASVRPARFGCTTWSRRRWSDRGTS